MKNTLFFLLKITLSLAILGFLVYRAIQTGDPNDPEGPPIFTKMLMQPKRWEFIFLGAFFSFLAVTMTLVRWWRLVCVQGLPAKWADTMRIGFIGYLFNLAPMGIVGGDLLKIWLLTKRHKDHRGAGSAVIASALMDRLLGFYILFLTAAGVLLACGVLTSPDTSPTVYGIGIGICAIAGAGAVFFALLLGPDFFGGKFIRKLRRLPKIGPPMEKIILAVRLYKNHLGVLLLAVAMSITLQLMFAVSFFFLMIGISPDQANLPLSEMLWIVPTCMTTTAIPLPIGPLEGALDVLFHITNPKITPGRGLVVSLTYRLVSLAIASLGVVFYFSARSEIKEVVKENG